MSDAVLVPASATSRSALHKEVATRLGVLPNFFCTAACAPGLIERLWDFARSAYFDSPLPTLFKERLFVHLSRFCEVRYCIVRHVGFLVGKGYPAGDIDTPPQSIAQVVEMLRRPVPTKAGFLAAAQRLAEQSSTTAMPEPETEREADLFDALTLIFLEPRGSLPARKAVARALGEGNLELLTAFLAFVRTAHFWTETHETLEIEPDMLGLMEEHADLAQLLLAQSEAERTWSPMERAELLAALAEQQAQLVANEQRLDALVIERTSELMVAEEALRQSQKMEAVGQLTGGLAHDFNNLLAGISGSLELMQTRMQQGRLTDVDRYMTAAQGAARRAAALTHRLLAFSRRQTLDPKPTNVNRLATGMQELIQRTVGPNIHIEVVGASGLWPTLVDPSQLENALLNLCINARDAMPDGGRITIETANKWLDERAAIKQAIPEGQYLSLCVTDTGVGMPPEVIARAFEPFFTTKPIGEGTGLGLSMIYGFAQQSGGQVRIYSEIGQGTTVCLYLPRHYGEVEDDDASMGVSDLPRSEQGETVLVVDDEPTVRMLVADILEDLGYTSIEAGDSAAGLKVLQSDVRIDLLVTDVGLPGGMNGRQMADAARVHRPNLKVLFITGYAENAILGNGQLAPGMAVLTKPFAIDTMAARIRSMIEGSKERARVSYDSVCFRLETEHPLQGEGSRSAPHFSQTLPKAAESVSKTIVLTTTSRPTSFRGGETLAVALYPVCREPRRSVEEFTPHAVG